MSGELKPVQPGYKRAWKKCAIHDCIGYYDYVPYSMANPMLVMPCGCDGKGLPKISEAEAMAIIRPAPAMPESVVEPKRCDMGVGCDEYGVCYAEAHGEPNRCPKNTMPAPAQPELTVWYGSMPESNGRQNWTGALHRKGGDTHSEGFCFARSEYPDRVRYEADRVRWVIGELQERPDILSYDADLHSGYVAPAQPVGDEVARLPDDVVQLVIAARELAFSDHRPVGAPETQAEVELIELFERLDEASEAFASRVPWNDEPEDVAHDRQAALPPTDDRQSETARLREALEKIASGCTASQADITNQTVTWMQGIARAALSDGREG